MQLPQWPLQKASKHHKTTREGKWSQKQIHGIGQYEVIPLKTENTFRAAVNGKFHV